MNGDNILLAAISAISFMIGHGSNKYYDNNLVRLNKFLKNKKLNLDEESDLSDYLRRKKFIGNKLVLLEGNVKSSMESYTTLSGTKIDNYFIDLIKAQNLVISNITIAEKEFHKKNKEKKIPLFKSNGDPVLNRNGDPVSVKLVSQKLMKRYSYKNNFSVKSNDVVLELDDLTVKLNLSNETKIYFNYIFTKKYTSNEFYLAEPGKKFRTVIKGIENDSHVNVLAVTKDDSKPYNVVAIGPYQQFHEHVQDLFGVDIANKFVGYLFYGISIVCTGFLINNLHEKKRR